MLCIFNLLASLCGVTRPACIKKSKLSFLFVHSALIHSQMFVEPLLCVRHRQRGEKSQGAYPQRSCIFVGEIDNL